MRIFNGFPGSLYPAKNTARHIGAMLLACLFISGNAHSAIISTSVTPVATDVGGYAMTAFNLPTGNNQTVTSATSLAGDLVQFTTKNGAAAQPMMVGDLNDTTVDDSWWTGSEDSFYYAGFNVNWVELILPKNTLAFSLTIDSNINSNAWILGVADDGSAVDTAGNAFTLQGNGDFTPNPAFNITLRNGQAESYGFYVDNSGGGSCNTLSKVVVDPNYWGMGDFSIHVADDPCGTVPEPDSLALMMLGLIGGLGMAVAKRRQPSQ